MIRIYSFLAVTLFAGSMFAQNATGNSTAESSASTPTISPLATDAPAKPFAYTPKPGDVVYGKDSAPLTVVEYASLSCPHCMHFYTTEFPKLATRYIDTGKIKLVYRNFPTNDPALKAAELVECADPDRRHAFIKVLFSTQDKWAYSADYRDALGNIAALGGIDRETFNSCMRDKKVEKIVGATAQEAQDVYKVHSTPTFFVGSKLHDGPHDAASLGKDIDAALAGHK